MHANGWPFLPVARSHSTAPGSLSRRRQSAKSSIAWGSSWAQISPWWKLGDSPPHIWKECWKPFPCATEPKCLKHIEKPTASVFFFCCILESASSWRDWRNINGNSSRTGNIMKHSNKLPIGNLQKRWQRRLLLGFDLQLQSFFVHGFRREVAQHVPEAPAAGQAGVDAIGGAVVGVLGLLPGP